MTETEQQRPAPETTFRVTEEEGRFILNVTVESGQRLMVAHVWTGRIEIGENGLPAVREMKLAPIEDTHVEEKTVNIPSRMTMGTKSAEKIFLRVARLCRDISNLEEARLTNGGEGRIEKVLREMTDRLERERAEQTPRTIVELQELSRQEPQPVSRGRKAG